MFPSSSKTLRAPAPLCLAFFPKTCSLILWVSPQHSPKGRCLLPTSSSGTKWARWQSQALQGQSAGYERSLKIIWASQSLKEFMLQHGHSNECCAHLPRVQPQQTQNSKERRNQRRVLCKQGLNTFPGTISEFICRICAENLLLEYLRVDTCITLARKKKKKNVPLLSIPLGYIAGTVTDPIKLHPFERTQWLILMNITQHSSSSLFLLSMNCPKYSSDFLQICPGTGQISNFGL